MTNTKGTIVVMLMTLFIGALTGCANIREISHDDFKDILENKFDMVEDKEPYQYSLSGRDNKILRVSIENDSVIHTVAFYNQTDIYHMYFDSSALAQSNFSRAHNYYSSLYEKGDFIGEYEEHLKEEYDYILLDGTVCDNVDEYIYGGIFLVDNMELLVYTNEDSDEARNTTNEVLSILGFPNSFSSSK